MTVFLLAWHRCLQHGWLPVSIPPAVSVLLALTAGEPPADRSYPFQVGLGSPNCRFVSDFPLDQMRSCLSSLFPPSDFPHISSLPSW